jgi:hypothetical protein
MSTNSTRLANAVHDGIAAWPVSEATIGDKKSPMPVRPVRPADAAGKRHDTAGRFSRCSYLRLRSLLAPHLLESC